MRLATYTTKELDRIYCKIVERITGWKWRRFEEVGLNMRTAQAAHPHLYKCLVAVLQETGRRTLGLHPKI